MPNVLNNAGYAHARDLIDKGKIKESSSWEGPDAELENKIIEEKGWEEFSKWFLGKDTEANDETKAKWKYPYTDDFENVNRRGLVAIRVRSSQNGDKDIFEAAGKLIEEVDKKMMKKRFLKKVDVHFISLVERGANGKKIIWKAQNANGQSTYEHYIPIKKIDEEKRVVYGIVYAPDEIDTQGDYTTGEVIEDMAYNFMKQRRITNVDTDHDFNPDDGYVCESWIVRKGDPLFPDEKEGAWAVGIKIENDDTWAKIKSGKYQGLSLAGYAVVEEVEKSDTLFEVFIEKMSSIFEKIIKQSKEEVMKEEKIINLLEENLKSQLRAFRDDIEKMINGKIEEVKKEFGSRLDKIEKESSGSKQVNSDNGSETIINWL